MMWRLLVFLVDRLVPASQRDEYLGDLDEERRRRGVERRGVARWAGGEALALVAYRLGRWVGARGDSATAH